MLKGFRVALSLLIFTCFCISSGTVIAKESSISVWDYWTYAINAQIETFSLEGAIKMEMSSKQTKDVSGTDTEILISTTSGNGTATMDLNGTFLEGPFELSGNDVYVESTFDSVSSVEVIMMHFEISSITMNFQAGAIGEFDDPLDLYIGNEDLNIGLQTSSTSNATVSGWLDAPISGNVTFGPFDQELNVSMKAVAKDVSIAVPAGTFNCWEIEVTEGNGTPYSIYYSENVGNYVKIEAIESQFFMGDMELKAYSYAAAGTLSITLIIIGGVAIAIIAIVLVAFIMMKRKGKGKDPVRMNEPNKPPLTPPDPITDRRRRIEF